MPKQNLLLMAGRIFEDLRLISSSEIPYASVTARASSSYPFSGTGHYWRCGMIVGPAIYKRHR
jgi:hypothetical protein